MNTEEEKITKRWDFQIASIEKMLSVLGRSHPFVDSICEYYEIHGHLSDRQEEALREFYKRHK